MGVFIFLFSVLVVIYFATYHNQEAKKCRKWQAIICTCLLVVIQGLRHKDIGIDTWNAYCPFFESLPIGLSHLFDFSDIIYSFEPGFIVYSRIVRTFLVDTQLFLLLCSIVSIVPIAILIYKYAENIPFAFIIFSGFILYHFGFSGIRQALAVGITAVAFEFIIRKKLLWFILTVLLASSFHASSILFVIAYPLYHHFRLSPAKMILVGFLFIILLFFLKPIVIGLTEVIFGGEKYMHKAMEKTLPSYNLMILLGMFLIVSFFSKQNNILPLRSMLLMAMVFQSLGILSSSASRMAYYFMPYISIAIPLATGNFKNRLVAESLFILFFVSFFFYCNAGGYLEVIPYKFFWE